MSCAGAYLKRRDYVSSVRNWPRVRKQRFGRHGLRYRLWAHRVQAARHNRIPRRRIAGLEPAEMAVFINFTRYQSAACRSQQTLLVEMRVIVATVVARGRPIASARSDVRLADFGPNIARSTPLSVRIRTSVYCSGDTSKDIRLFRSQSMTAVISVRVRRDRTFSSDMNR